MDAQKDTPKNLMKVPGSANWYVRFQVRGRTIVESTKTTDLRQAIAARNRIREAAMKAALTDRLGEFVAAKRGPVEFSRLAEIARAYEDAATVRGNAAISIIGAVGSLRRVVEGAGHVWESATAGVLTADTVDRYAEKMVRTGEATPLSVRSTLTQARSVFSDWAMEMFGRRFKIPDLEGFRKSGKAMLGKVENKVYQIPPADLLATTKEAATKLTGELRKAWLLCYGLGLRAKEAASVEWSWFRTTDSGVVLEVVKRDGWKPKASERVLPVPANLWNELQAGKDKSCTTILAGAATTRMDTVTRDLAEWMRGIGWETQHCAHELRAWKGSVWFQELGPAVAREWLGHRDVATTSRYYARLVTQPKPIEETL